MSLTPEHAALLEMQSDSLNVLLRVNADQIVRLERQPPALNISIVIDRSGSMSGRPIREATRCANFMLDRMQSTDRLSIISYDDFAKVEVPSQIVGDRTVFKKALSDIDSGGSTDLHAGWLSGAEQVAMHQTNTNVSRVLLLSDGNANRGLTSPDQISKHCETLADSGVQTSTYGLGSRFNEELMSRMAKAGLGNAYYGQLAEDLIDPFTEEFDLLASLCAKKLRLSLQPSKNVKVEVANQYNLDAGGRHILPDLAYGGDAWALLKLRFPTDLVKQGAKSILLLTAHLDFEDLEGNPSSTVVHLRLDSLPHSEFETVSTEPTVRSRVQELRAAEIQDAARNAARREDWAEVDLLLEQLKQEVANSPWLAASLAELKRYAQMRQTESFSKEIHYKSEKLRSRLVDSSEGMDWSLIEETDKASFLRRKMEQGKRFRPDDQSH